MTVSDREMAPETGRRPTTTLPSTLATAAEGGQHPATHWHCTYGREPCPNRRGSLAVTPTPAAASCLGPRSSVARPDRPALLYGLRGHALREAPAARKALPRYALPVTPCSAPSPEPHLAHDGALLRPASPCPALPVVAQRDVRTPDRIAGVRVAL
jgi:hypothetical protein